MEFIADPAVHDYIYHTGEASPLLNRIGIPQYVVRVPGSVRNDNQLATYLMIELSNGLAPPQWDDRVGEVVLVRRDNIDLTKD